MPLICPTCQIVFRRMPAAAGYFAWGCFDESTSAKVVAGPKICLFEPKIFGLRPNAIITLGCVATRYRRSA
jgi:hypothetical protein